MMLVLDITLKLLLFGAIIGGMCAAVFMWLNSNDSLSDQESYDDEFDARGKISEQFVHKVRPGETAELYEYVDQLKAYEMPAKAKAKPAAVQIRVRAPVTAGKRMYATMPQPADVVDAEVVDAPAGQENDAERQVQQEDAAVTENGDDTLL